MPRLIQDPIAGYWVALSEERSLRPNDFGRPPAPAIIRGECPFCPGNEHLTPAETLRWPSDRSAAWRVRVVPNKYPAITPDEGGMHEVVIDSPHHAATFGGLPDSAGPDVLLACQDRITALRGMAGLRYIQVFKNNGPGSGASLQHPHTQLLGLPFAPRHLETELGGANAYLEAHHECFYCDLVRGSHGATILESEHAIAVAPPAPRFAYETWMVPRGHLAMFEDTPAAALRGMGAALLETCRALERLLPGSAYNFLVHTAPPLHPLAKSYHWHIEILPRISGIGGYEFGTGCFINTVGSEKAAQDLRIALKL